MQEGKGGDMRRPPVYVTCMGGVWRVGVRRYAALLEHIAAGKISPDLDDWGKYVGSLGVNTTDLTAEQAADELETMSR